MTDEEIFDIAEHHGWLDDFGRWNFTDEVLIRFVLALLKTEREACARVCEADANARGKTDTALVLLRAASRIRARGEK